MYEQYFRHVREGALVSRSTTVITAHGGKNDISGRDSRRPLIGKIRFEKIATRRRLLPPRDIRKGVRKDGWKVVLIGSLKIDLIAYLIIINIVSYLV